MSDNKDLVIGRLNEQRTLKKIFDSSRSEFLALYGRRRVGKTYLIRKFFSKINCIYFQVTGVKNAKLGEQLYEFSRAVEVAFYKSGTILKEPTTWMQALEMLTNAIETYAGKKKVVLFFDELPWLATKRSRFLQALDYYWNTKWQDNSRIKLIVCGSAASWIIENIINNKGGLHNRLTARIRLEPFNLIETKYFLNHRKISLNNQQILQLYMTIGGIPHYLAHVEKGLSASQNIDQLCFDKNGILFDEFNKLYASLFDNSDAHEEIIRLIAQTRHGIARSELTNKSKLSSGGWLNKRLKELEEAGFISSFIPYKHTSRGIYYKIIDEYTLFYLHWIEPHVNSIRRRDTKSGYWEAKQNSAPWKTWTGYAFESICYKHISIISHSLKIPLGSEVGTWRYIPSKKSDNKGAQIDLLFDRDDETITMCEIKFSVQPFYIDKQYADNLLNKIKVFKQQTRTNKHIFITIITVNGLKVTTYSEKLISGVVLLDNFFE